MECAPIINFLQVDKSKQLLSLIRKCEQPVVFTSGVFDLLHVGHLEYLREAKRYGKSLIVGVNTDNSAKDLVQKAISSGDGQLHWFTSVGIDESRDEVSRFSYHSSVKTKSA